MREFFSAVNMIRDQARESLKAEEKVTSKELLTNFPQKNMVTNSIVQDALNNPENEAKIRDMQSTLGYNQKGTNYYNPVHYEDMKKEWADGIAWPFTIWAINNMIAAWKETGDITTKNISTLTWANDFIGTLHPYFYNKFTNADLAKFPETSDKQGNTIVNVMQKIQKWTANIADIQTMQWALNESSNKYYPSNHETKKDGVPGQYTQIALQNFVFKNSDKLAKTTS